MDGKTTRPKLAPSTETPMEQAPPSSSSGPLPPPAATGASANSGKPKIPRQSRKVILKKEVNRLQDIVNDMQDQVTTASTGIQELKSLVSQLHPPSQQYGTLSLEYYDESDDVHAFSFLPSEASIPVPDFAEEQVELGPAPNEMVTNVEEGSLDYNFRDSRTL